MNTLKLLFLALLLNACYTKETIKNDLKRCSLELVSLEDRARSLDPDSRFLCDLGPPRLLALIEKAKECQQIIERYHRSFTLPEDLVPLRVILEEEIEEKSVIYSEFKSACE